MKPLFAFFDIFSLSHLKSPINKVNFMFDFFDRFIFKLFYLMFPKNIDSRLQKFLFLLSDSKLTGNSLANLMAILKDDPALKNHS